MSTVDAGRIPLLQRLRTLSREVAASGAALPAEPALADTLGVSRSQLREALARLEYEGLIVRRPRHGTQVNRAALDIQTWLGRQEPFITTLGRLGHTDAAIEVVSLRFRRLDEAEAQYFEQPVGSGVIEVRKRWRASGTIHMLADYLVPAPHANGLDDVDEPSAPIFDLAERLAGAPPAWEVAHARADVATEAMATDLEHGAGTPLFILDLLGVSSDGVRLYRTVEHHTPNTVDYGFVRTFT